MEQYLEGSGDNWEGPDAITICSQYLKFSSNCSSFFELKESLSYNAHIISKQYLEGGATHEGCSLMTLQGEVFCIMLQIRLRLS